MHFVNYDDDQPPGNHLQTFGWEIKQMEEWGDNDMVDAAGSRVRDGVALNQSNAMCPQGQPELLKALTLAC